MVKIKSGGKVFIMTGLNYIDVYHKPCKRRWSVTKEAIPMLWCPYCKSLNNFIIEENNKPCIKDGGKMKDKFWKRFRREHYTLVHNSQVKEDWTKKIAEYARDIEYSDIESFFSDEIIKNKDIEKKNFIREMRKRFRTWRKDK